MTETKFEFDNVVFFGRDISEYALMFDLDLASLRGEHLLDCCSGPAAFASQAAGYGVTVTACDPLYKRDSQELRAIVDAHMARVIEKQTATPSVFHKELVPTSERRKAMEIFLRDFDEGKRSGRYVYGSLPNLPFADRSFDRIVCGNFLFLYSEIGTGGMMHNSPLTFEFHMQSLRELCRLMKHDLRIYPLQGPEVAEHEYLGSAMDLLALDGFQCDVVPVRQRDIIGAEHMLRVSR